MHIMIACLIIKLHIMPQVMLFFVIF